MDLGEETFEGGEAAAEGAGGEVEVDLGTRERACLGFKDVAGEILFVFDVEGDDAALGGDGAAGLDFVALVYLSLARLRHTPGRGRTSAILAHCAHNNNLLEMRDIDQLHMSRAGPRATGTSSRERVHLIGSNLIINLLLVLPARVRQPQLLIHLRRAQVLCARPLPPSIIWLGLDPAVPRWVIDLQRERERAPFDHITTALDERLERRIVLGVVHLSLLLVGSEIVEDGGEEAFGVCELTALRRDLKVELVDAADAGFGFDELAVEVLFVFDEEGVDGAALLDHARGLDLRVLEVAVRAFEGHEHDLAEEGDAGEEEAGDTLLVAVHAQGVYKC